MKSMKFYSITLLLVMIFAMSGSFSVQADYGEGVTDHCTTPTEFVTVVAAPSGADTDLTFNTTEIRVPENTCIQIKLINKAPTAEHDFVIDSTPGNDGINFVDIHLQNNTAGEYNNGTATLNIQSNGSNTFDFYCSIGDHRAAGMEGVLIVGDGTSDSLSFNPLFALSGIALISILVIRKKRD